MTTDNSGYGDRLEGRAYDLETPFVDTLDSQPAATTLSADLFESEFRLPTHADIESDPPFAGETPGATQADFRTAFNRTMRFEGGYANIAGDRGGETYKGVARNFHPQWAGWSMVDAARTRPNFPKSLDLDQQLQTLVSEFYKIEFWDRISGDTIPSQPVANELFDCAVNMGVPAALRILQKSLNRLTALTSPALAEDGVIGQKTQQVLATWLTQYALHPTVAANALLSAMLVFRSVRYIDIIERNSSQKQFAYGWFRRIFRHTEVKRES